MSLIRKHAEVEPVESSTTPARGLFDWPPSWSGLFDWLEQTHPRLEEYEEDGTLVVKAEMPGVDPDKDVEITIANGMLRIKAERQQETKTEETSFYRSEFRYGSYVRTVALPAGATEDDVKATYQDGILEVRVPLSTEQAENRKVPVSRT
jgi:HSP20 family protein